MADRTVVKRRETAAPLAAYEVNRWRAGGFLVLLIGMLGFALVRLVTEGQRDSDALIAMGVLILVACVMSWWVLRDLRFKGPILILERQGLRDLRRGEGIIAWEDIAEASAKRRGVLTGKGIRLVLRDGQRIDIEMYLMKGSPMQALEIINRELNGVVEKSE